MNKKSKTGLLALLLAAGLANPDPSFGAVKNVMCVKTNTGQYFPVVRVSMMVVPDGGDTFEIVLKDGQGEANVQSVSFEKHAEDVEFNDYRQDDDYIDLTKKIYLITNTGKYFTLASMPQMVAKAGTELFDVEVGSTTETNVSSVYFYRGDKVEDMASLDDVFASEEKLTLQTAISTEMQVSGCGDASVAYVFDVRGRIVAEAEVHDGVANVYVGELNASTYILRVGNKALKFVKK